tara:strand:+ start:1984 stop:2136 length:153 start_codon:yes stop_codon:yes gene_type:complete
MANNDIDVNAAKDIQTWAQETFKPGNLTSIFLSGIFSLREDIPACYLIFG